MPRPRTHARNKQGGKPAGQDTSSYSVLTVLVKCTAVIILKVVSHVLSFPFICIKKPIHQFTCMGNCCELKIDLNCILTCIQMKAMTRNVVGL